MILKFNKVYSFLLIETEIFNLTKSIITYTFTSYSSYKI